MARKKTVSPVTGYAGLSHDDQPATSEEIPAMSTYAMEPAEEAQSPDVPAEIEATVEKAAAPAAPEPQVIDSIIRNRVYASMATGLIAVPVADLAAFTAVQAEQLYRLAKAYNVPVTDELGKIAIGVVLAIAVPSLFTPSLSSLCRYIPIVGQGLSMASWPLSLGAASYAIGIAFSRHFASGNSLLRCDLSKIGQEVKAEYNKGLSTVKGWISRDKGGQTPTEATATA
jgi:uncharacterized protein (DUF697 family)